jgi:hypothetical protein
MIGLYALQRWEWDDPVDEWDEGTLVVSGVRSYATVW